MSLSFLMTCGKTIYMITYLVSLGTREISYLFNTSKYRKGEDTPRHISVKMHMSTVFYKCIVCFQVFDRFSRHLQKVFHVQIFLPIWLPERFLNGTNHDD